MDNKTIDNPEILTYIDSGELQEYKRSIRKAVLYLPECISKLKSCGFPEEEIHTIEDEVYLDRAIAKYKIKTPKEKCRTFFAQLWQYWDMRCLYFTDYTMSVIDEEKSLSQAEELCTHSVDMGLLNKQLNALIASQAALKEVEKVGLRDFLYNPFGLCYKDDGGVTRTYGIEDLLADTKKQLTEKSLLILRDSCKVKPNNN